MLNAIKLENIGNLIQYIKLIKIYKYEMYNPKLNNAIIGINAFFPEFIEKMRNSVTKFFFLHLF
jgi:hypothetical protein